MSVRAVILNDTRRGSFARHLGCIAVMEHLLYLCRLHDIDVVRSFQRVDIADNEDFQKLLPEVDLVLVNGEGTMHHDSPSALALARAILHAKAQGKKTALLNALWQDNRIANECLPELDYVCARDSFSAHQLTAAGATDVQVASDLSLYRMRGSEGRLDAKGEHGGPIVVDSVDQSLARELLEFAHVRGLPFRVMQDWRARENDEHHLLGRERTLTWEDLAGSGVMVSGRFHAVCFALKIGRPFLAVTSNSHKVEGLLHDAGLPAAEFILSPGWTSSPTEFWREHAQAAWQRHQIGIEAFAREASASIERSFSRLAERVGGRVRPREDLMHAASRRKVRVCYFNTWTRGLEDALVYLDRAPQADLRPFVSDPENPAIIAAARRDFDWHLENVRRFAAMRGEGVEFLPMWVSGQSGLGELVSRPRVPDEERWFVTVGHQPGIFGPAAAKVFSLLARAGVRPLYFATHDASRRMPCFGEIAAHLWVLVHDETSLAEPVRARLSPDCRVLRREWNESSAAVASLAHPAAVIAEAIASA